jgi:hypothetical protein
MFRSSVRAACMRSLPVQIERSVIIKNRQNDGLIERTYLQAYMVQGDPEGCPIGYLQTTGET